MKRRRARPRRRGGDRSLLLEQLPPWVLDHIAGKTGEPVAGVKRAPRPKGPKPPSHLEQRLAQQIRECGLPEPEREQCLIPGRNFRCDFVWRAPRVVVEADGGIWARGKQRHNTGAGFERDQTKTNLLQLQGWLVLRISEMHVRRGEAVEWIRTALALRANRADVPAGAGGVVDAIRDTLERISGSDRKV